MPAQRARCLRVIRVAGLALRAQASGFLVSGSGPMLHSLFQAHPLESAH